VYSFFTCWVYLGGWTYACRGHRGSIADNGHQAIPRLKREKGGAVLLTSADVVGKPAVTVGWMVQALGHPYPQRRGKITPYGERGRFT